MSVPPIDSESDEKFILQAIALGQKARINAPPNPWVGCVIVKNRVMIAEGFTQPVGMPHAEIIALERAGIEAKGSTVYVSLEPCCHTGRTPPCVDALIKAQVARVVVAIQDPDPRVNGNGIQRLQQAGLSVTVGVCSKEAQESLEPYLWQRRTGRPFCIAKAVVSIDGRIAAADHTSQWISCEEARRNSHFLRAESQAILVGSGTATSDKPFLTVRYQVPQPINPPLRVVLDSRGSVLPPSPLFDTQLAPTLIITSEQCPKATLAIWQATGAVIAILPMAKNGSGIDLEAALNLLGKRGIIQVLVEGGGVVIDSLIKQNLLNRLIVYVGPRILGHEGIPLFPHIEVRTIAEAPRLQLSDTHRLGNCVRIDYSLGVGLEAKDMTQ